MKKKMDKNAKNIISQLFISPEFTIFNDFLEGVK